MKTPQLQKLTIDELHKLRQAIDTEFEYRSAQKKYKQHWSKLRRKLVEFCNRYADDVRFVLLGSGTEYSSVICEAKLHCTHHGKPIIYLRPTEPKKKGKGI